MVLSISLYSSARASTLLEVELILEFYMMILRNHLISLDHLNLILIYLKDLEPHQRAKEHVIISQEVDLDERI